MSKKLINHFQSKQLSIEERMEAGKALRKKFPRVNQGDYKISSRRADPVSILEAQGKTRLQTLVPVRYARMLTSPFAFLRGGAAIMAADLAAQGKTTGLQVQACGDMHVANFGIFASAERNLVFGINDFDETIPAPWEWDLKRLAASAVAAVKFLGGDEKLCKESVTAAVRSYRKRIREYAQMGNLELWYSTLTGSEVMKTMLPALRKNAEKIMDKARSRTHVQVLEKLTDIVDEQHRLKVNAPFIVRETKTMQGQTIEEALAIFLELYFESLPEDRKELLKHYRIVDVVRKVVGVGSVGTRCWVIFLKGSHDQDPLFLQIKEAQPSVLEPFVAKSKFKNHGERVVAGQRLIQGSPDIFLGWLQHAGFHFYVRQLRDMKGGLEFDPNKMKIENFPRYTELCGWALALAHAKSGDAAMIAGYAGKSDVLDEAMVRFAFAYDKQTESDYKALMEAAKSGRIKVASESE
ncbi:MAG: DUF2252 domain-containing protein [Cyclobacteriaceae bacterium]